MKEKSEFLWFSSGLLVFLEWFLAGKTGVLEFVDNFSQFGKRKEKRFTPRKTPSKHDDLQASTPEDPGDFVNIKGWDGHNIDGGPSLNQGHATGRVDVPVGAMKLATSFGYVGAALLHRSSQCVVLVNLGSHVEIKEKTVFVHDTMAKIGIHNQDTIRCYGRLKGGAQRFRQPPQDIPGQWTCSLCGQERVET